MKRTLLLLIFGIGFGMMGWGQILTFEFSALAGNEATANSNSNDENITSSTISRGAGLTASSNGGRFNATSWALTSIANAVSGNDYMEFTITPNTGYQFTLSSIVVQWQRSNTGNTAIALRSSVDGYATDLDAVKNVTDNNFTQTFTWTFAQSNSSSAVTYRFYSYAEATSGSGGPGDGTENDIVVYGTTSSSGGSTPNITISETALTDFTYLVGNGPSAEQSFTISGSNLTADISIAPTTNYEISTGTGGSFVATNPINLTQSGGTVASTSINVRLKAGLSAGTYNSEDITATSTGADNKTVTCSGEVTAPPPPTITLNKSTLTGFTYYFGNGPSDEQNFTAQGSNLTANISIVPPTNYEISTGTGGSFSPTNPILLTQSGGTVVETTIYVRLKAGLSIGTYNSEDITASSTGADNKTVTCSGEVTAPPPPNAPVATAATEVGSNGFTANWNSVSGATGYNLDVFSGSTVELINTGFEGSTSFPVGWTQNSSYVNNGVADAHSGTYYAGMNAANDYFYTPQLSSPTTISFWTKASGPTANNTVKVQYSTNASDWTDLATYSANGSNTGEITTTYSQKVINVNPTGNYYIRWFMSARTGGSAYFDDILISGGSFTYELNDFNVGNVTNYPITDLDPGTTYFYRVRAYNDYGTSTNSNEIEVETLAGNTTPVITSPTATAITANSATLGGTITSDGGSTITERGTVWKTSAGVTITDNKLAEGGTSTGAFSHSRTSLPAGTQIFYCAFATNAIGTTLSGEASFYTLATEPTNHPTGFSATTNSASSITTTWSDNDPDPGQAASGFLVMANKTGTFTAPADGTAQTDDTDLSGDGVGVKNVAHGVETYEWNNGLSASTTYYFKIFAFNGASTSINYKTDGTVPTDEAFTFAGLDNDTEVYAPVTQISGTTISSLSDTQGEAEDVFKISIEDQGLGDGLPTKITNIRVKPHTTNTADWTNSIQNVFVDNGSGFVYPTATITDTYIDLAFASTALNVADGASLDVTLWIYLNTANIVDGAILSFMVDADPHGFTADVSGSGFATAFYLGDFNSNDFTLDVEATKLLFIQQPTNVNVDVAMTPAVTVAFTDANGNTDIDYDGAVFGISLTTTGTFSVTATTAVDPANGVSTFSNLKFSALGTGITITANDENWGNTFATSSAFNVIEGPSTLVAGDIAIVGYQSDEPDIFGFLLLTDVNSGTSITFTDNAWTGSALATSEGSATWTAPTGGLLKGVLIKIQGTVVTGGGSVAVNNMALATAGDQVLAYQGSSSSPTFIAAFSSTTFINTGSTTSNNTYLPTGLTNMINAFCFSTETDNGYYSGITSGTINFLRSSINNLANWTINNSIQTWPASWVFTPASSTLVTLNTTLQDLTIAVGEFLTINPTQSLTVSGTLTNSGDETNLVVESDATGTGSLICNQSILATVKRYLTQTHYHYIASPVAAQLISTEFINTSGTVASQSDIDLFKWDETTNTWDNIKQDETTWDPAFGANFTVAKGYVYANRASDVPRNFTGAINVADQTINLTVTPDKSNGWNIVGNPFSSTMAANSGAQTTNNLIDVNAALFADGGYTALYFWDESIDDYVPVNDASGAYFVSPGQAFMIKAKTHNSAFAFNANMRKHGVSDFYKSTNSDDYNRFNLAITGPLGDYNETLIGFVPGTTTGLDQGFDAIKRKGNANIALYSKLVNGGAGDFAIQALPQSSANEVVAISLDANKTGTYIFEAGATDNMEYFTIKLEDRLTNIFTTLEGNAQYSFAVLTAGKIENRFFLHFKSSVGIEDPAATEKAIYSSGHNIYFETSGNATLTIFNLTGQKIESRPINTGGLHTISIHAPTGWYIVKLISADGVKSEKIFIN